MARLARRLNDVGMSVEVESMFSPARWRELMSSGGAIRTITKLASLVGFPLEAALSSLFSQHEALVPTTNPFLLPAAVLLSAPFHSQQVVPLVYDLYPDALEAKGTIEEHDLSSRVLAAINEWVFRHADGIVFIGQRMAEHAIERYGEPARYTVIETGADAREFEELLEAGIDPENEIEQWAATKSVLVSYVGNMGDMHDWETLARTIRRCAQDEEQDGIGFLICASGGGAAELEETCRDVDSSTVRFIEPLGDRAWARVMALTDASVVTLKPAARRTCIPSKAFSAMAAQTALLIIAPRDSDLAELVSTHDCGVRIPPGDVDAAVEQLAEWRRDRASMEATKKRARRALELHYDVSRLAEHWSDFLHRCSGARSSERSLLYECAKRALDIGTSAALLAATAPLQLAIAAGVLATMGSPVFFRQKRPGRGGRPFEMLKFRTMRESTETSCGPESDAERITRLGRLLRSSSLDELPTLLNVLKGDMSLVGPRPLLMRYLNRYDEHQKRRHEVKPGVTGWAQVNGRNALSWEEKFDHDVWYVDHRSLVLDLKILFCTLGKVIDREGISRDGHATMPEFFGSE